MASSPAVALLEGLEGPRRDEVAAIADLDDLLRAHLEAGARAWPAVALEPAVYLRHLADKLRERASEAAADVLRAMPVEDLYLAAACVAGDAAAIDAFRQHVCSVVRPALGKLAIPDTIIDETEQRVLIMVLVGDPARPAIEGYAGRGRLRSWVRSIAVRTGRRLAGVEAGPVRADEELDRLSGQVDDPELALLRARYREQVRAALAEAFAGLTERARNVLRQYYIDGLTIDQLAVLHRVDRATTARWVIAARSAVLAGTRDRLRAALGASAAEVESLVRGLRSQLEISLRLL